MPLPESLPKGLEVRVLVTVYMHGVPFQAGSQFSPETIKGQHPRDLGDRVQAAAYESLNISLEKALRP